MRRLIAALAVVVLGWAALPVFGALALAQTASPSPGASPTPPASQQEPASPSGALIIGLPVDEFRALLRRVPAAAGLGVYPPSRDAAVFFATLARGDVDQGGGVIAPAAAADRRVAAGVAARAGSDPVAALAEVFGAEDAGVPEALAADLTIAVVRLADDAQAILRLDERPAFAVATGGATPVWVARLDVPEPGLLDDGVSRRPGIVTPADLARTILAAAGVPTPGAPGRSMTVRFRTDAVSQLDALAERLEDDLAFPRRLTEATFGVGLGGVAFGTAALVLRRRRLARAFAAATAAVPAGYVAALFLEGASWQARAGIVAAAAALGFVASRAGARRVAGWVLLGTTFALGGLTVVAESARDGAVALSLWGNPLDSWRFFGLRNHLAAFLAGGYVAGAVLLALPVWLFVAGAAVVAFAVAAPTLGANFVAVLTLGFAVTLVALARAAGRPRFLHLPFAAVVGGIAIGVALAADAGTPVSHGGRAVESIRAGGASALWDIVTRRARLNVDEITGIGVVGVVAFALAAFALALLFWWSLRADDAEHVVRAGVGGLAAAALVALVIEDSGFFMGAILGIYPWLAFALERAAPDVLPPVVVRRVPTGPATAPAPPEAEPEHPSDPPDA